MTRRVSGAQVTTPPVAADAFALGANARPIRRRELSGRGFTIVEVVTVIGIVGILAGMSAVALTRLKSRGNYASATGDFVAGLRAARAESFARGDNTVVVIDPTHGQWWAFEDSNGTFTSLVSTGFSVPSGDRLISQGTLPANTSFGPSAGVGYALPAPICGIPTGSAVAMPNMGTCTVTADGGVTTPSLNYCSFCSTTGDKLGAIIFLPGGGAQFLGAGSGIPATIGQQVAMQDVAGTSDAGQPSGIIDFAIVSATGSIQAVTVKPLPNP